MWKRKNRDIHQSRPGRPRASRRVRLIELDGVERLDQRIMPAVSAIFSAPQGVLTVFGDAQDNTIVVSRDAAGSILVNGGAVAIRGIAPTVANTTLIDLFGLNGDDNLSLDETNGALPRANIFGGAGNDVLTGGSGNDLLFGDTGNDTLFGKGGNDLLIGGDGNDVLTGGAGTDQVLGQAGNDFMIWNPGDGTDLNEGGSGTDTVVVNGSNAAENFTIAANGSRVRVDRVSPAPFSLDIGTTENLIVNGNGGDDTITAGNGLASLIQITMDGGAGNDTLTGGDGSDFIIGGDGNDVINGGRGNDVVLMGAGDDTFVWNPGDGSDSVDGQAGNDNMIFNGSNASETFAVSANGQSVRLARNVGNVVMDLNGIEGVNIHALGGADTIRVNDLTGTDLTRLNLDLSAGAAPGVGDGLPDSVVISGTAGNDAITVGGSASRLAVTGLATSVDITGTDPTMDALAINAMAGDDRVDASALQANTINLALNGGDGNDVLIGSAGNDVIDGGRGSDVALMGAGDDTFEWDPGDGSDTVDGQAGHDRMLFNGSDASENIDIAANGQRVRFTRDVGNITMDLGGVERVDFNALGGADNITVNDLTGTDLTEVNLDLASPSGTGTGDGQADSVVVNGTNGDDAFTVVGDANRVTVAGPSALVNITGAEAANDRLVINTLGGNDVVDASGLSADAIPLTVNGGDGDDFLIGGAGNDSLNGGDGNDFLTGGPGVDILDGGRGDNTLIQD